MGEWEAKPEWLVQLAVGLSDPGHKWRSFKKVKEVLSRRRNGGIEMGPEASRAARFPQQQQKPWQEGERVAVGGEEGVQQCWSGHRGLGSLL